MRSTLKLETRRVLQEAHDWLVLTEDSGLSEEERRRFQLWLDEDPSHSELYDRAITVRAAMQSLDFDDIDADLLYREKSSPSATAGRWFSAGQERRILLVGCSAALFAAVFLIAPDFVEPVSEQTAAPIVTTYESSIGQTRNLQLDDGTKVVLGARSTMTASFSPQRREVNLQSGAAYFDVAKEPNRPFSVTAGDLVATALGTVFDVRANAQVYRVGVAEGAVAVAYPFVIGGNKTSMIATRNLVSGETVVATPDTGLGDTEAIDASNVGAWRFDRLTYTSTSLSEFIADVNRLSSVPVELDNSDKSLGALEIRGVFVTNNVDDLLLALTEIHPVIVDRTNPSVVVVRARDN